MPSYAALVHSLIDWDRVERELNGFRAISSHFPLDAIRCQINSPFFCHFLLLRLALYRNSALLNNFEELLQLASQFPGWNSEFKNLQDGPYDRYFSMLWQLQVAQFLYASGATLEWNGSWPDLKISYRKKEFFAECYVHYKMLGMESFIMDILNHKDGNLQLTRRYSLAIPEKYRHSLQDKACILESLLGPLSDTGYMQSCRQKAGIEWPVEVSSWPTRTRMNEFPLMSVVLEGSGECYRPPEYIPGMGANNAHGDPAKTLKAWLNESAKAKQNSNNLKDHRPNVVFIQFLSIDHASAFDVLDKSLIWITDFVMPERLPGSHMVLSLRSADHPVLDLITKRLGPLSSGSLRDFLPAYRQ
jgi:hypothetical protein